MSACSVNVVLARVKHLIW